MRSELPSSRRLLRHAVRAAASRALPRVGNRMPISKAMIPITTSSSTKVKAWRFFIADFQDRRFLPSFHRRDATSEMASNGTLIQLQRAKVEWNFRKITGFDESFEISRGIV